MEKEIKDKIKEMNFMPQVNLDEPGNIILTKHCLGTDKDLKNLKEISDYVFENCGKKNEIMLHKFYVDYKFLIVALAYPRNKEEMESFEKFCRFFYQNNNRCDNCAETGIKSFTPFSQQENICEDCRNKNIKIFNQKA